MRMGSAIFLAVVLHQSLASCALAQVGKSSGGGPISPGFSGPRIGGSPSFRPGTGLRNSPIANPAPSLTPLNVMTPRGSLNSEQLRNPYPSLNRPRLGNGAIGFRTPSSAAVRSTAHLTEFQLRSMTTSQLGESLQKTVAQLRRDLGRFAKGDGWKNYLRLDELAELSANGGNLGDVETMKRLRTISEKFESVADDKQYEGIANRPTFVNVQHVVRESTLPQRERMRRAMLYSAEQLRQSLNRYPSGDKWNAYLKIPSSVLKQANPSSESIDDLTKVLGRFKRVSNDPNYRIVARQSGFRETSDYLARYIECTKLPSIE